MLTMILGVLNLRIGASRSGWSSALETLAICEPSTPFYRAISFFQRLQIQQMLCRGMTFNSKSRGWKQAKDYWQYQNYGIITLYRQQCSVKRNGL